MRSLTLAPASGHATAVAAGAAVAAALAGSVTAAAFDQAGTAVFAETLSFGIAVSAVAVTGAVITLAVPGNRVGWLLLAAATAMGIGSGCTEAGVYGVLTNPGSVPGAAYLAGLGPGLQGAGMMLAVTGVPAIFPDGRPVASSAGPSSGWSVTWPGSSAAHCTPGCCARICNGHGNASCWRARKNGAACDGTCTTASGRSWPG
jgi:hypothetical protein